MSILKQQIEKRYFKNKKLIFEVKKSKLNFMYGCKSCKTLSSDASATKKFYVASKSYYHYFI
jgi:hypothetical protein